ncbi:hypothetical protein RRG08_005010 [Elysia crispata]|uniref:Uncharacterized protein n=1 Tax=Elysia crispata TaxID=231223 RepID=A0AAE1E8T3_9GAST|nr:hypothetical protein RRG08_005010 [Elysia crispata]
MGSGLCLTQRAMVLSSNPLPLAQSNEARAAGHMVGSCRLASTLDMITDVQTARPTRPEKQQDPFIEFHSVPVRLH